MYKLDVESEANTSIVQRFWYSSCLRNADLLQLFFCRNEMRVESRDSDLRNLIVIFLPLYLCYFIHSFHFHNHWLFKLKIAKRHSL